MMRTGRTRRWTSSGGAAAEAWRPCTYTDFGIRKTSTAPSRPMQRWNPKMAATTKTTSCSGRGIMAAAMAMAAPWVPFTSTATPGCGSAKTSWPFRSAPQRRRRHGGIRHRCWPTRPAKTTGSACRPGWSRRRLSRCICSRTSGFPSPPRAASGPSAEDLMSTRRSGQGALPAWSHRSGVYAKNSTWSRWLVDDQRDFATRTDVLTYTSAVPDRPSRGARRAGGAAVCIHQRHGRRFPSSS